MKKDYNVKLVYITAPLSGRISFRLMPRRRNERRKMNKRTVVNIVLAAAMVFSLGACGGKKAEDKIEAVADGTTVTGEGTLAVSGESIDIGGLALGPDGQAGQIHTHDGMKLIVPLEYDPLLTIEEGKNGMLFSVSETASVEAAKKLGEDPDGAGFLFAVARVSRDEINAMRCQDMSGADVVAGDDENCYVFYHPTDVRIIREESINEADQAIWSELNEWAFAARESFVAENGLTPLTYGNSSVEIALARAAYGGAEYTLSTTEYGPLSPAGVDAVPFVERLTANGKMEYFNGEAPDGEYAVLTLPGDGVRYDFFSAAGSENLVREVYDDGTEHLFKAEYADASLQVSAVVEEWYHAVAQAHGLI